MLLSLRGNPRPGISSRAQFRILRYAHMPLGTLARKDVVHAARDTPVTALAQQLRDESVGSVVITNDGKPIGIVTDRDLTTRVLANGDAMNGLQAGDIMTSDLHTATPDVGLYEAAQRMREHDVRRLPICDDDGALCGIITADDVIELLADEHQQLASVIKSQRPPY